MARTVKHFNLHRINGTELRVISDVEMGVLPLIQEEETVIRAYLRRGAWPHRLVSLFILEDLQPLARQISADAGLLPGGAAGLNDRPILHVYDLQDLASCHVFVNQQAMMKEGYWDDTLAIRGLLAHEHAHPLSENETTRAARCVQVELTPGPAGPGGEPPAAGWHARIWDMVRQLLDKLCLSAPREVFANDIAIAAGFAEGLLHLNHRNVVNAQLGLAGRAHVHQQMQQMVSQAQATPVDADQLMVIGDLRSYLDLAMEIAPLYRAGLYAQARQLETSLEEDVFPALEPEVAAAYRALRELYIALRADLALPEMAAWCQEVAAVLAGALAAKQLALQITVSGS